MTSTTPAIRAAVDLNALRRFLDDRTTADPDGLVSVRDLYDAWLAWADEHVVFTRGINTFTSDIQKARPGIHPYRPRDKTRAKLPRHYRGLTLN